jgi:hypothetical protein
VVWGADRHGIDAIGHFVEHLAEVDVLLGLWKSQCGLFETFFIDIAQGDDVAVATSIVTIAGTLAVDTDTGKPNGGVG